VGYSTKGEVVSDVSSEWPDFAPDFEELDATLVRIRHLLKKGVSARGDYRDSRVLAKRSGSGPEAIAVYNDRWLGEHFKEANVKGALWAS
jgi:hypothetical protein